MGSIKISKLGCKIMSGLTACIIGLSPCIGTQVSAIWIPSANEEKNIENCTKEELQEVVPDLWQRFWTTVTAASDAARDAAEDAADDAANDVANGDAAGDAARDAASDAAWDAALSIRGATAFGDVFTTAFITTFITTYANAWKPSGAAYVIVKDKDRAYFENLVRVLEEQIAILEDIANTNQH